MIFTSIRQGLTTTPEQIAASNDLIERVGGLRINSKATHGARVVAYGDIPASKDFPLRRRAMNPHGLVVSDGTILYALPPGERGARGYVMEYHAGYEYEAIIFRLIHGGIGDQPHLLHWRTGNYRMYTHPAALLKRSYYYITDFRNLKAVSDMRFAAILNLAHMSKKISMRETFLDLVDKIAKIDKDVKHEEDATPDIFNAYREVCTESNPNAW